MWMVAAALLAGLLSLLYYWNTRNYGMFAQHGIFEPRKTFPFGSDCQWDVMFRKKNINKALDETYCRYKVYPVIGLFHNRSPVLVINDLELARLILIKDFDHFGSRRFSGIDANTYGNEIFANMLPTLAGEKWKKVRSIMSPAFTSGKLKAMTPLINQVGADLTDHMNDLADKDEEISVLEVMNTYMLDCIATSGFGLEGRSFKEPEGKFRKMAGRASARNILKLVIFLILPKVFKALKIEFFDTESLFFFADVIKDMVKHRKETGVKRGDLIDLVLEALEDNTDEANKAREDDQFEKDAQIRSDYKICPEEIELLLISNALMLFFVGFDTSSTSLSVTLGFLAKNPDVQDKLHQELRDKFEAHGTQDLDYDTIQKMPYLDMVLKEVLRFYFTGTIERVCTNEYKLPDSKFVIPKGMLVQIPASGIQRESKYYPDPDHFNPDVNWSPKAKAARSPYSFLSFGQGPRNCIGMRFALLLTKMALVRIIGNFKVLEGPSMPKELTTCPKSRVAMPKGGVWCRIEKRTK